ncbi:sulfonate ABC transporter ATP-binding protein [Spirochaetia bacterium]|nr:sulfonate ABC transporter ATP-binding protein [Spirochaetia bacterium]
MSAIYVSNLNKTFQNNMVEIKAVQNLTMEVQTGSFTSIVGKSGCGKTTFLKLIAGLQAADSGTINFEQSRIGFMFQDARLLPWRTVRGNLLLAFPSVRGRKNKQIETQKNNAQIENLLQLVGLAERGDEYPSRLSGGMAQRAALARCLCRNPGILLLDEPFSALDAITRKQLRVEMSRIWRKLRITVILVTHDIEEAVFLSDTVLLMNCGTITKQFTIPLEQPRIIHTPDFQNYCREIEECIG